MSGFSRVKLHKAASRVIHKIIIIIDNYKSLIEKEHKDLKATTLDPAR